MRTYLLTIAAYCLISTAAIAQDRPPEAPEPQAESPLDKADDTRPPEKPASSGRPDEIAKSDGENDGDEPDSSKAEQVFGPPPPPRWFMLRESDGEEAACRLALAMLGTRYEDRPAITDAQDRDCGIARPIRVTHILPDLELEGDAEMRCDTARALGLWARNFLRPAAAALPGAPRVTGLRLGTTYACRTRIGTGKDRPKLSEHALGNAIDIMGFTFADRDPLDVEPRDDSGGTEEAFQRAVRGAACLFFTTVLGPGANAAHANHLHLDLADRRSDWRLCQ